MILKIQMYIYIYHVTDLSDLWASKKGLHQHALTLADEEACNYHIYTAPFSAAVRKDDPSRFSDTDQS